MFTVLFNMISSVQRAVEQVFRLGKFTALQDLIWRYNVMLDQNLKVQELVQVINCVEDNGLLDLGVR